MGSASDWGVEFEQTMRSLCISVLALLALVSAAKPENTKLRFDPTNPKVVKERLAAYKGSDKKRGATLKGFFQAGGCTGDRLTEQPIRGMEEPNVICLLPGDTDAAIVVGAHYDHAHVGEGVVDNWSGASLLPSLYQALKTEKRHHTFRFIGFSGEERGLVGSDFYVRSLSDQDIAKLQAMVNLDTLGLGPTEVWVSRSDQKLVTALVTVAQAMKLPVHGMNVDKVGYSDEESFLRRNVPTLMIHSLTQTTLVILHSPWDTLAKFTSRTITLLTGS